MWVFDRTQRPTRDRLSHLGWRETTIGVAAEREVNARGGLVAKRLQYALKHISATTIDKSQGATLPYGLAVEISRKYALWETGHVVVLLSRS